MSETESELDAILSRKDMRTVSSGEIRLLFSTIHQMRARESLAQSLIGRLIDGAEDVAAGLAEDLVSRAESFMRPKKGSGNE